VALWHAWLDLVLPPRCGSCLEPGTWLCDRCRSGIRRPAEPLCPRCGRELGFTGESCSGCSHLRHLASVHSLGLYEGPLERLVHRFKYQGWRCLAGSLSGLLLDSLAGQPAPAGLILAVPLHPQRERERGFNQAELLAARLRRRLGVPPAGGRLLRTRPTPPQVGQDRVRRRQNVAGAFSWSGKSPSRQPVLLVDDVITTGATLEACAGAMRSAGSGRVTALTLARVGL
jgi:ComF family protein